MIIDKTVNSITLKNVVTYKPVWGYILLFIFVVVVFIAYSSFNYVSPFGLIFWLVIVVLSYMWVNYFISSDCTITLDNHRLIIETKKIKNIIPLTEIRGFYFHTEETIDRYEQTKKGLPSSIEIYLKDGSLFVENEYSSLFLPEKYDQNKSELFKNF